MLQSNMSISYNPILFPPFLDFPPTPFFPLCQKPTNTQSLHTQYLYTQYLTAPTTYLGAVSKSLNISLNQSLYTISLIMHTNLLSRLLVQRYPLLLCILIYSLDYFCISYFISSSLSYSLHLKESMITSLTSSIHLKESMFFYYIYFYLIDFSSILYVHIYFSCFSLFHLYLSC